MKNKTIIFFQGTRCFEFEPNKLLKEVGKMLFHGKDSFVIFTNNIYSANFNLQTAFVFSVKTSAIKFWSDFCKN